MSECILSSQSVNLFICRLSDQQHESVPVIRGYEGGPNGQSKFWNSKSEQNERKNGIDNILL